MWSMFKKPTEMPTPQEALPGRAEPILDAGVHAVNGHDLMEPYPEHLEQALFGMGCFWGAERMFWQQPGVYVTAVGYAAGHTPNPTYEEVCSGQTGHNEVVRVAFDPELISYGDVLAVFWEGHDPTQGMRQGNDVGTQYRSGIYFFSDAQQDQAVGTKARFEAALIDKDYGPVTTEILPAPDFYFAESYHQQYLAKNPGGYCGLGGTGVRLV